MEKPRTIALDVVAGLILLNGVASYVFWESNEIFNAASLAFIVLYILMSGSTKISSGIGWSAFVAVVVFASVTLMNGLYNATGILQVVTQFGYAVSLLFFIVYGYRFLTKHRKVSVVISVVIVCTGGILAAAGIALDVNVTGARQGFLGFPAVQGLARNVNYNVVMSVIAFIIVIGFGGYKNRWAYIVLFISVAMMMATAGSRGGVTGSCSIVNLCDVGVVH